MSCSNSFCPVHFINGPLVTRFPIDEIILRVSLWVWIQCERLNDTLLLRHDCLKEKQKKKICVNNEEENDAMCAPVYSTEGGEAQFVVDFGSKISFLITGRSILKN